MINKRYLTGNRITTLSEFNLIIDQYKHTIKENENEIEILREKLHKWREEWSKRVINLSM